MPIIVQLGFAFCASTALRCASVSLIPATSLAMPVPAEMISFAALIQSVHDDVVPAVVGWFVVSAIKLFIQKARPVAGQLSGGPVQV